MAVIDKVYDYGQVGQKCFAGTGPLNKAQLAVAFSDAKRKLAAMEEPLF